MKKIHKPDLQEIVKKVRQDILFMSYHAKSAHMGGALSSVEILVSLYFSVMNVNPKHPSDPMRDRFVFSKGHDAKALYAVLAQRGYFPRSYYRGYECDNGKLPGHSTRGSVPGIEISAGSLGHGLSQAAGMAYGLTVKNVKKPRVFAVLSDGECDEGSTWEAILFAGHHKLDNLTVIVDYNKLQGLGSTKDILNLEPLQDKFVSFGWSVREIDGHSIPACIRAFRSAPFTRGKPSVVIAHTIKGKGGPGYLVGSVASQYKSPTEEEYQKLIQT
jgi:transketolase